MKLQKRAKIIGGGILVMSIIVVSIWGIKEYRQVSKLSLVSEPIIFAENFDPNLNKATSPLEETCGFWAINCEGHDTYYKSPFFPYQRLISEPVGEKLYESCQHQRNMIIDPLWKIFWIQIAPCGQYSEFFGPYRGIGW